MASEEGDQEAEGRMNQTLPSAIRRCGADTSGGQLCTKHHIIKNIKLLPTPGLNGPSVWFSTMFPLAPDVVLLYVGAIICDMIAVLKAHTVTTGAQVGE